MIIEYHDSKGEGRRLLNVFPNDVLVLTPDQEPINHIAPKGPIGQFCWGWMAAFAKCLLLHLATWPEAAEIYLQVLSGVKPGDPLPSLIDLRDIFHKLAKDGYRKFLSVAGALDELCTFLGRTAFIRVAPSLEGVARVIVYEQISVPHTLRQFFAALRFIRLQAEAAEQGREDEQLRRVVIEDEGQDVFSNELSPRAGSGFIAPSKHFLTQGRSTGTGVVASIQSLFGIDDILTGNAATTIVFRYPDPTQATKAAELLGDSQLTTHIQNLPDQEAYVCSAGFSGPVKIRIPNFDLGPYPSDAKMKRLMADKLAALAERTVYAPDSPKERAALDYLAMLGQRQQPVPPTASVTKEVRARFLSEHKAFLAELRDSPTASVTEHYRRLRWGAGRGNRIKNQLLEMGLIVVARQRSKAGRPVEILLLTDAGKELLNENTD